VSLQTVSQKPLLAFGTPTDAAVPVGYCWKRTPEMKPMAAKRRPIKKRDPNQLTIAGKPGEDPTITAARTALNPTVQAAVTLKEYGKPWGNLDLGGLIDSLSEQTRASSDGDLHRARGPLRSLFQICPAGAVTVPVHLGDAGKHPAPAGDGLRPTSQHRQRPAAGEQRIGYAQ